MTLAELKAYDGRRKDVPILVAVSGRIYNIWRSRWRYEDGGDYGQFAGRECGRSLSKMSFEEADIDGPTSDLPAYEEDILEEWVDQFESKVQRCRIALLHSSPPPPPPPPPHSHTHTLAHTPSLTHTHTCSLFAPTHQRGSGQCDGDTFLSYRTVAAAVALACSTTSWVG